MIMLKLIRAIAPINKSIQQIRNSSKYVDIAVSNQGIATVTMQRKPVNSLNLEMLTELHQAFVQVEQDNAKGMILTSAQNKIFSAGFDMTELYKPDQERLKQFVSTIINIWLTLYGLGIPTVAMINGHAPAAACLFAICCDYRIMIKNYTIGFNEARLGLVLPDFAIATLRNIISRRQAELALTTGAMFSSDQALAIGMVDEVVGSKEEAILQTEIFFKRFTRIERLFYKNAKIACRGNDLQRLMNNKEEEIEKCMLLINQPSVQKQLEVFIKSAQKKET